VNNPLTAVLGNTQLLLMQADRLDPQFAKRLRDIEQSAMRIKDVTQRLLKQDGTRTTEYPGGLRMLDLSDTSEDEKPDADA
jgi:signal transduction histidine kinase